MLEYQKELVHVLWFLCTCNLHLQIQFILKRPQLVVEMECVFLKSNVLVKKNNLCCI